LGREGALFLRQQRRPGAVGDDDSGETNLLSLIQQRQAILFGRKG
jgi:hypothetical protein